MDNINIRLGKRLRMLRKKSKLTQEGLAQTLNAKLLTSYGKSAVSKWESEDVKPPTEVLEELERLFGQKDGYLLEAYNYLDEAVKTATRLRRSKASEFQAGILKLPLVLSCNSRRYDVYFGHER